MMVWLRSARRLLILIASLLLLSGPAYACAASAASSSAPQSATDVLEQMSDRAGVIFVGQVAAVRNGSFTTGVVEIDFRVETAIRGCSIGLYTLREWAGLWAENDQRYRLGERFLVLLHAPGPAGLSSPIDGLDGVIPIWQGGIATSRAGQAASERVADLRWLGAKILRPVSYRRVLGEGERRLPSPVPFVADSQMLVSLPSGAAAGVTLLAPVSSGTSQQSEPAEQISLDAVIGLLQTRERSRNVAP